jgi:hypothetical protein
MGVCFADTGIIRRQCHVSCDQVRNRLSPYSAELSRSLKVLDRVRHTQKPVRNRSESVCAGLRAPSRALLAYFRPVWGPTWAPNRRFPAGFLKVLGALFSSVEPYQAVVRLRSGWLMERRSGRGVLSSERFSRWRGASPLLGTSTTFAAVHPKTQGREPLDNVPHVRKLYEACETAYNGEGTALTMCHMCKTS